MYKEMQDRLSSLERRVATTEAAVTIPETTVTTSHNDDGIGVGVGIDTVSSAAFRGYDVIEDSNANPEDSGEGFRGGIAMPRGAGAGIGSGAGERRAVFTVGEAVQANGQVKVRSGSVLSGRVRTYHLWGREEVKNESTSVGI